MPFVHGGAELHVRSLVAQLRARGYDAELVRVPFKWYPKERDPRRTPRRGGCSTSARATAGRSTCVIATKFPTYFVRHPNKVAWLIHQYRAAYELCGTPYSDFDHTEGDVGLRDELHAARHGDARRVPRVFANARNTAARLRRSTASTAEPLYHPPQLAGRLRRAPTATTCCRSAASRSVKRVDLAIEAMAPRRPAAAAGRRRRRHAARERRGAGRSGRASAIACAFLGAVDDEDADRAVRGRARGRLPAVRRGLRLRHARGVPRAQAGRHGDRLRRAARVRRGRRQRRRRAAGAARRWPPPSTAARPIARRAAQHGDAGHERARWSPGTASSRRSSATRAREQLDGPVHDAFEAHHPDPVPQRGGDAAGDAARTCREHPGHRRHRGPGHRRRVARRHRRTSRAPAASTTSSASAATRGWRRRSRAGHRRLAQARRRLHRQHRRRQPVRRRRHRRAAREPLLAARPTSSSAIATSQALQHMSCRASAAAAARQLGRPAGVEHARCRTRRAGSAPTRARRRCAMTIVSEFSYTLESIIQAGKKRMAIAHVPIRTNPRTRESRLFDSVLAYIKRSAATIVRIYAMYEPLKVFTYIGGTIFARRRRDLAAVPLLLPHRHRPRAPAVADPVGGADDRRVPGAAHRPARRRDLRPTASCSRTCSTACGRSNCRASPNRRPARSPRPRTRRPRGVGATARSPRGRSVNDLRRHPGLQRGRRDRRGRARRSRPPARGTRSSSSTTGRATRRARARPRPGAIVVRHPYNKGNGAAVKSGIRRATGEYVLIIDGDGQHRPEDARRLVERLGEYDLVIGARSTATQATQLAPRSATPRSTGWRATSPGARFPI